MSGERDDRDSDPGAALRRGGSPRSRARPAVFRLLAVALSLLVGIGGSELFLRLFWPQPPRGFSARLFEMREGRKFVVPGADGRHRQREFDVSVAGNRHGYRAGTWANTDGLENKIWLFGDSFVFGWGVEADETVSSLLTERGWPTANFGIPGDGLRDYAHRLRDALASDAKPPGIVLVIFDDDLPAAPQASVVDRATVELPRGFRLRQRLLALHGVRLLARGLESVGVADLAARASGADEARRQVHRSHTEAYRRASQGSAGWREFNAALGELVRAATSAGERPCVVVHLRGAQTAGGELGESVLRDLGLAAEDYDFAVVETMLAQTVREAGGVFATFAPGSADEARAWTFAHDSHLNAAGHRELARRIESLLRQSGPS